VCRYRVRDPQPTRRDIVVAVVAEDVPGRHEVDTPGCERRGDAYENFELVALVGSAASQPQASQMPS